MDQLACIQATLFAHELDIERNEHSGGRKEMLAAHGGELLDGSGFESEEPESGFEEQEVS